MRERTLVLAACALGGVLTLFAAGRPWVVQEVRAAADLPAVVSRSSGADLVPVLAPLALVALAAVAALLATRGWARRIVGGLLLLDGAAVVAAATTGARSTPEAAGALVLTSRTGWPWVAVLGGMLLLAAGLVTAVRGGSWGGLSRRYERPSGPAGPAAAASDPAAPVAAEGRPASDAVMWDAIDRGQDPTRS